MLRQTLAGGILAGLGIALLWMFLGVYICGSAYVWEPNTWILAAELALMSFIIMFGVLRMGMATTPIRMFAGLILSGLGVALWLMFVEIYAAGRFDVPEQSKSLLSAEITACAFIIIFGLVRMVDALRKVYHGDRSL